MAAGNVLWPFILSWILFRKEGLWYNEVKQQERYDYEKTGNRCTGSGCHRRSCSW